MLEELSAYRIIIDPPEKVGEIDIGTIMNLIRTRITQNGGSAGSSYDITTRDEIERFLAHVKYPSGMDRSAKLWWLMGKVMEWAGPTFTIGYYRVSMYDTGICVITLDNREYGIYRVDLDELQLDSIELGDYDSFVVYFPYENRGR